MSYVQSYIDHYAVNGRSGAGGGDGIGKIKRWEKAGFVDGMSVLDYGCGCGAILDGIQDRSKYLGVDIVPQAIEYAMESYPGVDFRVIEPGKLECPIKQFVGAGSVFTHTDKELVGASLADIFSVMDENSKGIIDILEGDRSNDTEHLSYWILSDFQDELIAHSLSSVQIDKVDHRNGFTHTYLQISRNT